MHASVICSFIIVGHQDVDIMMHKQLYLSKAVGDTRYN